ncbi:TetR family transcriptional regulator [Pseudonocardia eucalypti]|uniref:TetR family transcriptional regulator n=1 Tax=Pseudonocardia eucalypti TaxID=648755 RepID=A0ABP9R9T4_9PSEU|nr:AcrR family transcriptional regulator [Pseudonocardia eucalypti]
MSTESTTEAPAGRARAQARDGADTRTRLLEGALETLRDRGIAGASARVIASAAGVNQALIFYHFGSVGELLTEACAHGSRERAAVYAAEFSSADSLSDLLELGVRIHKRERAEGNVIMLAQMLAGAQAEPKLAEASAAALSMWVSQLEGVLERALSGSVFAECLDVPGLARALAAAFVGFGLYDAADHEAAEQALAAMGRLGALIEMVDDLGPMAQTILRAKLRKAAGADSVVG